MPYQGPNGYLPYVPPPNLNYGSRGQQQQDGQAQRAGQAPHPQQPRNQNYMNGHLSQQQQQQYRPPANYSQTAYSTPQFYNQGQPSSFYQSPSPSIHYQQQPYLPTPTHNPPIRDYRSYSPDPLQEPAPQPYRGTPAQQSHRQSSQHRPSQAGPPSSFRQSGPSSQWPDYSSPTYLQQANASATARSPQMQPQPQQHRPLSQQRPQGGSVRLPPTQIQAQQQGPSQRTPSNQHHPQTQIRPPHSQLLQSTPQSLSRPSSLSQSQNPIRTPSAQQTIRPGSGPNNTPAARPDQRRHNINPDVSQRRVAHVEIPVHRAQSFTGNDPMARSSKRRRFNDGQPLPICEPEPQPQQYPAPPVQKSSSSSSTIAAHTPSQAQPSRRQTPLDYQAALLALSDEYVNAAYSMTGALSTAEVSEEALDEYHALLSTGMGCLDSVIRNYHISDPRKEARIRLRLASLLYEETDNDMETEEILSKGITICERARLVDLKYAMQHLLARVWFKGKNVKAAMKAIDKLIVEVEKLNLVHWNYTFRFLRVSIGLQAETTFAETSALVRQLHAIQELGSRNYHISVQLVASTLEALVHLRSRTPECVDLAQRAMAAARTHQLSEEIASMPQIKALLDCIDLACNLQNFRPDQAQAKTEAMQRNLDASSRDAAWSKDGSWQVLLCAKPTSSGDIGADTGGLIKDNGAGAYTLTFNWLSKTQLYTLGFLLSGLATIHKNASHEQKAEEFLHEGIKMSNHPIEAVPQSMNAASAQYNHQRMTRMILRLYVVFGKCGRADWERALKGAGNIRNDAQELEFDLPSEVSSLVTYLEAVCKHGLGDLQGALKIYRSDELSLSNLSESRLVPSTTSPIKVLAALNSIPILRHNSEIDESERLLERVQEYCLPHSNSNGNIYGNKALESAFFALKATEPPDVSTENIIIIKTKQYLQSAVQAAKNALNNQLLCMVMNLMTNMFFKNIVGGQAEKSVRAGRSLAKKSQDKLWMAVADQMYAETLERCGKLGEAAAARLSAQEAFQALPDSLKTSLASGGVAGVRMSGM